MPSRPAADRGSYVDFVVFVDDALSVPEFNDTHFNPTVLVPSTALIANLTAALAAARPQFMVSIGDRSHFGFLERLPAQLRETWTHLQTPGDLSVRQIEQLYWRALQFDGTGTATEPLLSAFTPAYKSGDKLMIPYTSLLSQTYQNWEWVVYDDSPPDHAETWHLLTRLAAGDSRVRPVRSTQNDGYIGSVKRRACNLATGDILVELDHDDVLLPECLDLLREAYVDNPDAGFFFSDGVELMAGSNASVEYGTYWAFNQGSHYRMLLDGAWVGAATAAPLNAKTLRHIISMPNHVRAWRRTAYHALGGHARGLPVADDYELSVRSLAAFPSVYIRHMTYLQWRQPDASTFTFKRNALIQRLVKITSQNADAFDIHNALVRAGMPDSGQFDRTPYWKEWRPLNVSSIARPWRREQVHARPDHPYISIVVATYNNTAGLMRAVQSVYSQNYTNWELLIVGDDCPLLDAFMQDRKGVFIAGGRHVRWYNMKDAHGGQGSYAPRNYAVKGLASGGWIAYLDDHVRWAPDHLSSMVDVLKQQASVAFMFASLQLRCDDASTCGKVGETTLLCSQPKHGRIDTSAIMHRSSLVDRYGAWRPLDEAHGANDWDLVSRWVVANETWAPSLRPTVIHDNATPEYVQSLVSAYDKFII